MRAWAAELWKVSGVGVGACGVDDAAADDEGCVPTSDDGLTVGCAAVQPPASSSAAISPRIMGTSSSYNHERREVPRGGLRF
jgi:hypothetical protein